MVFSNTNILLTKWLALMDHMGPYIVSNVGNKEWMINCDLNIYRAKRNNTFLWKKVFLEWLT